MQLTVLLVLLLPGSAALRAPRMGVRTPAPRMGVGMPKRVLAELPFAEARAMARAMGMSSKEEWDEYSCPGAYRLPKDADVVWAAEWCGWDDWLGVPLGFEEARQLARTLGVTGPDEFAALKTASERVRRADTDAWNAGHALRMGGDDDGDGGVDLGRLPVRPDLYYHREWAGWSDFIGPG